MCKTKTPCRVSPPDDIAKFDRLLTELNDKLDRFLAEPNDNLDELVRLLAELEANQIERILAERDDKLDHLLISSDERLN
jgi:hypothetical protein